MGHHWVFEDFIEGWFVQDVVHEPCPIILSGFGLVLILSFVAPYAYLVDIITVLG